MYSLTATNITLAILVLSVLFNVFQYFRKPQEEEDKKASLLAQQVQWEKEANERRFKDVNSVLTNATALAQNHIHSIDVKVDSLSNQMIVMGNKLTELGTIINERIPQKK